MSIAEVAAEHKLRRKISTNSNNDDVPNNDADEDVVENSGNHVQRRNSVYL